MTALLLAACGGGGGETGGNHTGGLDVPATTDGGAGTTETPESLAGAEVRWSADALPAGAEVGPGEVEPASGSGPSLVVPPASTGAITVTGGPEGGQAFQFPAQGVAVLRSSDPDALNPGDAPIEVSAWVSVRPEEVGQGANVVAKGTFDQPQWKVQADGGIASCRFSDGAGHDVVWKGARPHDIADSQWYRLTCTKTAEEVSLTVQRLGDLPPAPESTPASIGAIANDRAVTVGGKGTGSNNDQWRGRIGDVTVRIG